MALAGVSYQTSLDALAAKANAQGGLEDSRAGLLGHRGKSQSPECEAAEGACQGGAQERICLSDTKSLDFGDAIKSFFACLPSIPLARTSRGSERRQLCCIRKIPNWVSGRSETKTYGKGVALREPQELQTLPRRSVFGKDRDERSCVFNALHVLASPAGALFSGKLSSTASA